MFMENFNIYFWLNYIINIMKRFVRIIKKSDIPSTPRRSAKVNEGISEKR